MASVTVTCCASLPRLSGLNIEVRVSKASYLQGTSHHPGNGVPAKRRVAVHTELILP